MINTINRNKAQSVAGGSSTIEKKYGDVPSTFRNLTDLWAISQGQVFKVGNVRNFYRSLVNGAKKYGEQKMNSLLEEAVFNPEIAETFLLMSKKLPVDKRLKSHLYKMAIIAKEEY